MSREESSLTTYIKQISKIPLLSSKEEEDLAKRIKKSLEISCFIPSTIDEEILVERIKREGLGARKKLIESNLRLVIFVTKKYQNLGVPLIDLVQEGNIGLTKSVDRYDPSKGKFATYAVWWIRQSILKEIPNQARNIRIPSKEYKELQKLKPFLELNQSLSPIHLEELSKKSGFTPEKIKFLLNLPSDTLSLSASFNQNLELSDIISDEKESFLGELIKEDIKRYIHEKLEILSEKERGILNHRYSLDNNEVLTLDEIGQTYGITRQRVKQIQNKALKKLEFSVRTFYAC